MVCLCCYEIAALTTRRFPTLSELQQRYRLLGPTLLISLAVHFYEEDLRFLRSRECRRVKLPAPELGPEWQAPRPQALRPWPLSLENAAA